MVDARLRKIFAEVLSAEAAAGLTAESNMETVKGWDSQTFVAVVVGIENEFNIRLSTLEAARMSSVASIVEVLRDKGVTLSA